MFKRLEIFHWRQFEDINIDVNKNLTVLTGANGAGKTTLLNIFGKHFGWNYQWISTPSIDEKTGSYVYLTGVWKKILRSKSNHDLKNKGLKIGSIEYLDAELSKSYIYVPKPSKLTYDINFAPFQKIEGMHIPSHRPVYQYKEVEAIPTKPKSSHEYFDEFNRNIIENFLGSNDIFPKKVSANYILKQSLIALATFGYGNSHVAKNKEFIDLFEGFQLVLKRLLPKTLGFERFEIRMPEVVLITKSGDFSLDSVSGGIASIIGMAWQIYIFSKGKNNFVITIDEPENHLHPSMQRELMPGLIKAFPKGQFIVATHSPFIVSSCKEASVYALSYKETGRVYSRKLDMSDKSGDATKILREVLGVPVTMPVWVENEIKEISSKYAGEPLSENLFERMRHEMSLQGLENLMPDAVSLVVAKHDDKTN